MQCSSVPVSTALMPARKVYYLKENGSQDTSRYESYRLAHCVPDPSPPANQIEPVKFGYTECKADEECYDHYGPL